jgi:hypothetical protein
MVFALHSSVSSPGRWGHLPWNHKNQHNTVHPTMCGTASWFPWGEEETSLGPKGNWGRAGKWTEVWKGDAHRGLSGPWSPLHLQVLVSPAINGNHEACLYCMTKWLEGSSGDTEALCKITHGTTHGAGENRLGEERDELNPGSGPCKPWTQATPLISLDLPWEWR